VGEFIVTDYLAVGQKTDGGADERVILFVKLPMGQEISDQFEQKIKAEIRARRSPRHVPARVCVWFPFDRSHSTLHCNSSDSTSQ